MRAGLLWTACGIALLGTTIGVPAAGASVTLGTVPDSTPTATCSNVIDDWIQPEVVAGPSYRVPAFGTITSWRSFASTNAGQHLTLKVFQSVGPSKYRVTALDGP